MKRKDIAFEILLRRSELRSELLGYNTFLANKRQEYASDVSKRRQRYIHETANTVKSRNDVLKQMEVLDKKGDELVKLNITK